MGRFSGGRGGMGLMQFLKKQCLTCGKRQTGNLFNTSQRSDANPTSHPVVSSMKSCISSKCLKSEARKKMLLEIQ